MNRVSSLFVLLSVLVGVSPPVAGIRTIMRVGELARNASSGTGVGHNVTGPRTSMPICINIDHSGPDVYDYNFNFYNCDLDHQSKSHIVGGRVCAGSDVFCTAHIGPQDLSYRVIQGMSWAASVFRDWDQMNNCLICVHEHSNLFHRTLKTHVSCGTPATTDPSATCYDQWHSTPTCHWTGDEDSA